MSEAKVMALRPREAAQMLSICERTLWRLTKLGKIRCVKLGEEKTAAVLYPVAELERFLTEFPKEMPATAPQEGTKESP